MPGPRQISATSPEPCRALLGMARIAANCGVTFWIISILDDADIQTAFDGESRGIDPG